ncbi:hypothetical protein Vretimale_14206 [Volvox reticuliferus]|uniref:Uncharacterized protein n=1 Tax=Volvox reticuliferus TaxID=1737510 RepID=A0A8J4GLS9_9CHLO|nr:hypothetical protein Vretifemale_15178 [Volvox reticuliferus]GIM10550.1 hypothetical protein Vretimale_14206 [Volvox reticuliferus]
MHPPAALFSSPTWVMNLGRWDAGGVELGYGRTTHMAEHVARGLAGIPARLERQYIWEPPTRACGRKVGGGSSRRPGDVRSGASNVIARINSGRAAGREGNPAAERVESITAEGKNGVPSKQMQNRTKELRICFEFSAAGFNQNGCQRMAKGLACSYRHAAPDGSGDLVSLFVDAASTEVKPANGGGWQSGAKRPIGQPHGFEAELSCWKVSQSMC